jgi:uncharacterized membrane protein YccC
MKRVLITGFLCALAAFLLSWFVMWDWPPGKWTLDQRMFCAFWIVVFFIVGCAVANETRQRRTY